MPTLFDLIQEQERNGGGIGAMPPPPQQQAPTSAPTSLFDMIQQQEGGGISPSGAAGGTEQEQSWGSTLLSAGANLVPSAINDVLIPTVKGAAELVTNPVGVGKNLADLGVSGITEGITNYIAENYGSEANFKKALAKHPAQIMSDLSMVLFPAGAAAKAPGIVGKVGKAAAVASNVTDPLTGLAKGAGVVGRGAQNLGAALVGATSATGQGPKVAIEAGRAGAYEGAKRLANKAGANFNVPAKGASPDDMFTGQMRSKRDAEEHVQMLETGIKNIKKKGQDELDAALSPLWLDRTKHKLTDIDDAIDAAERKVSPGGNPVSPTAHKVVRSIRRVVEEWRTPPKFTELTSGRPRTDLASKSLSDGQIKLLGLDPKTATAHEYLVKWFDSNRTTEGLDKLKQRVQDVYEGYKLKLGAGDPHAKQAAATVSEAIIKKIDAQHGGAYSEAMKPFGKRMRLIRETLDTFGYKRDTQSRRLTAMNRDNVVADYGARIKLAREFEKEAGTQGLLEATSGRSLRGIMPRNLASGTLSVGGALYATSPVGLVLAFATHMPRVVGEASHALGKVQGWVIKPTKLVKSAFDRLGISPHAASLGAQATGRAVNTGENRRKLKNAITFKARKMGYAIHDRVANQIASQLTSDDVDTFLKGINHMGKNERLMKIIKELGTKGEQ